ncbi:MAG: PAS domain-containing protein [Prevotellaceae bacterium]|jgi:nitrogen fixation/metabolism regulation signal transduction histidine kinase|nr:PAS domain-containing protein [Prevotellaceae bacterium]
MALFKSIQYRLYFYMTLLVPAIAGTTFYFVAKEYVYAVMGAMLTVFCFLRLGRCYRSYSRNFDFLLNALENGDYTFHFPGTGLSMHEREMNAVMNRIKDILANARKEVIENENFLSLILESVSTGIIILDDMGIVQRVNRTALDMLGLSVFTHSNQLQTINETYPELFRRLKNGDIVQITLPTEREELQISLQVSQIRLKRGMMRIITLSNIGNELEMKEMESWIRLIRVMTHEIMNSIAPVTSLSETMLFMHRDASASPESLKQNTLEAFEAISSTASGLLLFVESYRKFTAIPKPKIQDFSLNALIDKIVKLHETAVRQKNIELTVSIPEPLMLSADENLISQALINLVKNAVEAVGNEGKITLSAGVRDHGRLSIHVANTGEPIPPDILPHIFVPFFTTKPSGSGIGLSVSQYIMRLHGGKLQHSVSGNKMTVFSMIFHVL